MTLIKNEDTGATAPGIADPKALDCTLEQSFFHRKGKDVIRNMRGHRQKLDIFSQRTTRVHDSKRDPELPSDIGTFPLYSVANCAGKMPGDMAAKGGLFLLMWISLKSKVPFAVQVFARGVNAVSGEPTGANEATMMPRLVLMEKKKSIQDYVVTPKQLWLDGIATDNERVRQCVAMPLGSGYSVEVQVTGQDVLGGLQLHVTPSTSPPTPPPSLMYPIEKVPNLSLEAPDPLGVDDCPFQLFTATFTIDEVKMQVQEKTDSQLRYVPASYMKASPLYKIYGETSTIHADFNGIKSVEELDKIQNRNGKRRNEGNDALKSNKKSKGFSVEAYVHNTNEEEDGSDDDDDGLDVDEENSDEDEESDSDDDDNPTDDNGDEHPFQNPVILLNPNGSATGEFTSASELMEELSCIKLRDSKLLPGKE
ncbi:MAG: hypothetical protein Q9175_006983 [Cornicularia normoerica]